MDDFATTTGLRAYIETKLIPPMERELNARGSIGPIGVVFACLLGGDPVDPTAVAVGPGTIKDEKAALRKVRGETRLNFRHCNASGALTAIQRNQKVIFQLESPALGDLVWDATVAYAQGEEGPPKLRRRVIGPLRGARTPEAAGVTPTKIRPARWMD